MSQFAMVAYIVELIAGQLNDGTTQNREQGPVER
jgi:hypothetical protein